MNDVSSAILDRPMDRLALLLVSLMVLYQVISGLWLLLFG